jgi:hypothetical protein
MSHDAATTNLLAHPEWVGGRRLWMDGAMREVIRKIQCGDPVRGWEGDPNLAVYWDQPNERWELWRLEDDGEYRKVCQSTPGIPFDERVIDGLVSWDQRRRKIDLHAEVTAHNDRVRAERMRPHHEYMTEEAAPRLRHAMAKDGLLL